MRLTLAALSGAILLAVGADAATPPDANPTPTLTASTPSSAQVTLKALLDEHVEQLLQDSPTLASIRGDLRYNDRLEDHSPRAYAESRAKYAARLERLAAIRPGLTAPGDLINCDLLSNELRLALDGAKFMPEQMPVDDRNSPATDLPQLPDRVPLNNAQQVADYVSRLEKAATLIDQDIEQMRAGLAAKRVPTKGSVVAVVAQTRAQAREDLKADPTKSPLYRPLVAYDEAGPLAVRARKAITEQITPAMGRLADFLEKEYVPHCRDSIAAKDSVDGIAWYNFRLRESTTTSMTADEIHTLGLSEVARIRAEMFRAIGRSDFAQVEPSARDLKGDELFAAFTNYLRTSPRFYYTDTADLLRGYRDIAKRADAELPRLFRLLPRNPYGVREMPRFIAESSPTAYYNVGSIKSGVPGYFVANTFRLDQRPKYEMTSLTLHEAVPGHHLERTLTDELEGQHPFRSFLSFTAFVEGWGLYSERLGMEMEGAIRRESDTSADTLGLGMYKDPYDDFGRLSYEMWRALRLVVDTGLHAKGWSRNMAIEYMLANSALTRVNVEREVDRYIAWPGQACAYKLGELKIRALRARAETALGDRFDIREFHEVILGAGPLPLEVLESRVDAWLARPR